MPKFDEFFLTYYEQERADLVQQLEHMQSGEWKVLDRAVDITSERIENTTRQIAQLDTLADKLAGG
jgi:hypothetical protein